MDKQLNLSATDNLSFNLRAYGRNLKSFSLTGISSIVELYLFVKSQLEGFKGIVTIHLRNISQGWSNKFPLCLR